MHNSNYSLFLVLSTPAPAEPSLSRPSCLGCACSGLEEEEEGGGTELCGRRSSSRGQTQAPPTTVSICSRGRRNES